MTVGTSARRSSALRNSAPIILSIFAILLQSSIFSHLPILAAENYEQIYYTTIGCVFASIVGYLIANSISRYPGTDKLSYIVPGFCVSFGILLILLIFLRIPYSRILLTGSFIINIVVFLSLTAFSRRRSKLRIGVVCQGQYRELPSANNIEWNLLEDSESSIDGLDAISVDLWSNISDAWERQLAVYALRGIPVYHLKHLKESLTGKVEIERLSENNFGTLSPLYAYMSIKHLIDWFAAFCACIVFSPVFLVIALAIRFDSPGPIIFRQKRIGYQGRTFQVFKFRTMTADNQKNDDRAARDAAMTKDGDRRITRLGRVLRKSRIDELPQILNILRGEMSWIGPRPEAEVLSRWYEAEIPFYRYRHIVRPGITGWAQVHQGHAAEVTEVREKLNFDFYYIKNYSPWIDIIIVARTIKTMASGFGAR